MSKGALFVGSFAVWLCACAALISIPDIPPADGGSDASSGRDQHVATADRGSGSGSSGPRDDTSVEDAGVDGAAPDAGVIDSSCSPGFDAPFQPTAVTVASSASCTKAENQRAAQCLVNPDSCPDAGAACRDCVFSNESASVWGLMVGAGGTASFNLGGCFLKTDHAADAASCGVAYEALLQCTYAACVPGCAGHGSVNLLNCVQAAGAADGVCQNYLQLVDIDCAQTASVMSALNVCINLETQELNDGGASALIGYFCGGADAGEN